MQAESEPSQGRKQPPSSQPDGWAGTATKVAGLLAGAVAATYLLGGAVIALRLLFEGFSASGVATLLAQMPRELVVSTALIEVIGPAVTVGLVLALIYGLSGHPKPLAGEEDRLNRGPRAKRTLVGVGLLSLLVTAPALSAAGVTDGLSLLLIAVLVSFFVTFGLAVAGLFRIRRVARETSWSQLTKAVACGAIWAGMAVLPAALLTSALIDFEEVQVCSVDSAVRAEGTLLSDSPNGVLVAIDSRGEESIVSFPTDVVRKVEYGDLATEFPCAPESAAEAAEAAEAVAALGGHGSEREQELAMSLRPLLQFDSDERWRPLAVDSLIAESFSANGHHGACPRGTPPGGCPAIDDLSGLRPGVAYLDIHGDRPNGTDFGSPGAACAKPPQPVVDCTDDGRSAIYYRRTSHGNRWYWDFWWFFRYNDYNGEFNRCAAFFCGDHEGDWEGITVITDVATEPQVLGAIYAAHRERILVERGALPLVGRHPRVFVADGTHASYPFVCAKDCSEYTTIGVLKLQVGVFEEGHDGAAGWADNGDESCERDHCVRALPEGGGGDDGNSLPFAGGWAAWPGHWGATCFDGCPNLLPHREPSPSSPGNQPRFRCPWIPTLKAAPQVGGRGPLTTRPVGDKLRLSAACRAQRGDP
jgi:hypothetical protein